MNQTRYEDQTRYEWTCGVRVDQTTGTSWPQKRYKLTKVRVDSGMSWLVTKCNSYFRIAIQRFRMNQYLGFIYTKKKKKKKKKNNNKIIKKTKQKKKNPTQPCIFPIIGLLCFCKIQDLRTTTNSNYNCLVLYVAFVLSLFVPHLFCFFFFFFGAAGRLCFLIV